MLKIYTIIKLSYKKENVIMISFPPYDIAYFLWLTLSNNLSKAIPQGWQSSNEWNKWAAQ